MKPRQAPTRALIDMGMNQKQAVATLYMVASMLGLCAVMLVTRGYAKVILSVCW